MYIRWYVTLVWTLHLNSDWIDIFLMYLLFSSHILENTTSINYRRCIISSEETLSTFLSPFWNLNYNLPFTRYINVYCRLFFGSYEWLANLPTPYRFLESKLEDKKRYEYVHGYKLLRKEEERELESKKKKKKKKKSMFKEISWWEKRKKENKKKKKKKKKVTTDSRIYL